MSKFNRVIAIGLAGAAAGMLGGCKVTDDFEPPQQQVAQKFLGSVENADAGTLAVQPVDGAAAVATWWESLNDPMLTELVQQAQTQNLDLEAAATRIEQARANANLVQAGLYPDLNVSGSATRSRSGGLGGASTGNQFRAGFDASWEIDVFGGVKRQVESAEAAVRAAEESRRSIMVSLAAEVAANYLDVRGAQEELEIARRNITAQEESLEITQARANAGFVSSLDVANAKSQLASTRSRVPTLEGQIRASEYAIALLLGLEPGALIERLSAAGPIPACPGTVALGLPSELLLRRPDIRKSLADLHAATARVGAATAQLYPSFSLSGSAGLQGNTPEHFASIANRFWSIGPSIRWPMFDAGKTRANIAVQRAAAEESLVTYKKVVLTALSEAETSLINLRKEQERRVQLREAVDASRNAVAIAQDLYVNGKTDFLNVLSAQTRLYSAEDSLSVSDRTVVTNLITLFKALGGGWDVRGTDADPATPRRDEASGSGSTR